MQDYLRDFDAIHAQQSNSFGSIASFGEQRLREIRHPDRRAEMKQRHNNFGLGKTHLQVATAKELIKRGYATLIVSDVTMMDEMSRSKAYSDEGEEFQRLLGAAIHAKVLVWDDIGKSKITETRKDLYYQIINERYKTKRPIIFSSNEDQETLTEKIGDAAASRLFGMAKGRVFAVEGPDYRLTN
jgi:DNA replication protein DnaC